jgi:2-oxoisovalerate dehydrogenase E2 component (dihydrolipoyl transacylase)
VALPDLGEGTKEATIKEWYVKPGAQVQEFDDLVEVFTDKLVAKIPSTHKGLVKAVHFKVDEVCLVGHNLIDIEIEGEDPYEVRAATLAAKAASQKPKQAGSVSPNSGVEHGPGKFEQLDF